MGGSVYQGQFATGFLRYFGAVCKRIASGYWEEEQAHGGGWWNWNGLGVAAQRFGESVMQA